MSLHHPQPPTYHLADEKTRNEEVIGTSHSKSAIECVSDSRTIANRKGWALDL